MDYEVTWTGPAAYVTVPLSGQGLELARNVPKTYALTDRNVALLKATDGITLVEATIPLAPSPAAAARTRKLAEALAPAPLKSKKKTKKEGE